MTWIKSRFHPTLKRISTLSGYIDLEIIYNIFSSDVEMMPLAGRADCVNLPRCSKKLTQGVNGAGFMG
jgi:hypothetical protein